MLVEISIVAEELALDDVKYSALISAEIIHAENVHRMHSLERLMRRPSWYIYIDLCRSIYLYIDIHSIERTDRLCCQLSVISSETTFIIFFGRDAVSNKIVTTFKKIAHYPDIYTYFSVIRIDCPLRQIYYEISCLRMDVLGFGA